MKFLIIFLFIAASCSFQKKDSEPNSSKKEPYQSSTLEVDSDGDGDTDSTELSSGSDPYIADLPTFSGDFFEEMEVKLEVYNKLNNSHDSVGWRISNNKIKFSWEDTQRESEGSGIYMESLLKSYAANYNFKKNNFKFYDYNEGISAYSSPVYFEDSLLSISNKLLDLQRQGHEINKAYAVILSSFKITSKKYASFRNPVFDIYYKSKNHEGLIFIESKRIDGTYAFNEENKINIYFESFDSKIINEALLSGGASFFLKLRDFTVYDTNEDYSSILEKVQASSVPVTIAHTSEDKKTATETIYVGTNGKAAPLHVILGRAFKNELLMTPTSIDQIRGLSNRQQSYESTGLNETIKWFVGSGHVEDNIYSYLFKPNEGIGLAYISDKKLENRPIYASRTTLSSVQTTASSGKLPLGAQNLKIKLIPLTFQVPVEKYVTVKLANCPPKRNWEINEITYNKVISGWDNRITDFSDSFQADAFIAIKTNKGSILEGSIQALVKDKYLTATKDAGNGLTLSLSKNIAQQMQTERSQISVELLLVPKIVSLDIGRLDELKRVCYWERSGGPEGPIGPRNKSLASMELVSAMNASEFGYRYDLDVHILSY